MSSRALRTTARRSRARSPARARAHPGNAGPQMPRDSSTVAPTTANASSGSERGAPHAAPRALSRSTTRRTRQASRRALRRLGPQCDRLDEDSLCRGRVLGQRAQERAELVAHVLLVVAADRHRRRRHRGRPRSPPRHQPEDALLLVGEMLVERRFRHPRLRVIASAVSSRSHRAHRRRQRPGTGAGAGRRGAPPTRRVTPACYCDWGSSAIVRPNYQRCAADAILAAITLALLVTGCSLAKPAPKHEFTGAKGQIEDTLTKLEAAVRSSTRPRSAARFCRPGSWRATAARPSARRSSAR